MEQAVAKQHLKQNLTRVFEADFWNRIRHSESGFFGAARSFRNLVVNFLAAKRSEPETGLGLKDRLMVALTRFPGHIQIILSGGDPATAVFRDAAQEHLQKVEAEGRLTTHVEPEANHMFARSDWREHLIGFTLNWTLEKFGNY
jgi:hypothetical protein